MKKQILLLYIVLLPLAVNAQQNSLSESYFTDKYNLAPSYAGNYNAQYLFLGYRSDWTGIPGGPKTLRLSYNDLFPRMTNAGYGGRLVYDKAGIFSQLYMNGSYSYDLQVSGEHHILFGLSAGFYKNRLNLLDYYNDPGYTIDPSLINRDIKSKLKFTTDFSFVWQWKNIEAGLLFSNLTFGDASYKETDLKYNPLSNYHIHASYMYTINEEWKVSPLVIVRGGEHIRSQFELASQVIWQEKFMGSLVFRDPGILGFGIGANIGRGLMLAYNFNFATNVAMGAFNNHEITIGINLWEYLPGK